ncbi:hypothetical protein G4H71_06715 [Rhodococcus triatomae]|uniref:Uncharacterized protein n=1 Tax=Rhodococcus triatomae TaxID=300028 RepID=A0A1G8B6G1_9NOCA|nr:DUF6480 family protein [Rhodococcus triatomae]QNG17566.1 hypothetical protein G4H72_01330 [Rhodococcus triatomae]QNG22766.1 hypothetical protein G4H71_06715 [Rhodococcus triatomae]SDH28766.1 hypothetical protein SAMN05444695_101674 [Rhodococcus triatomae]
MSTPDHTPPDPDPDDTPDLEEGGGVSPGATPPGSGQTSGLSEPEPSPHRKLPMSLFVVALIAVLFVVVAVGIVVM